MAATLPGMRYLFSVAAIAALGTTPVHAGPGEIPMVGIGLPFSPETPTPVPPTHALYHDVEIGDIRDLPPTIKSSGLNFIAAAKRSSVNAALRESFAKMNLAAQGATPAHKRLIATWLGDRTPFHIGTSNATKVTIHYRLERIDNGKLLFDRDITTTADGGGVDASMRDNGIVRAAIAANFASAANCLDRAAYGTAPADCALTPRFHVSVVRIGR